MKHKLLIMELALALTASTAEAKEMAKDDNPKKAYMVSNAHLDTQWNWDVQTTIRQYIWNTMVQNFRLFELYPNYIFNFEGGIKYSWMKEYYPLQYEKVKQYIKQGRWHITGSAWDANETIICSPESWIRNVALGQTFYRQEFQKEGTDIFLPDCFGFPYTLPTLAAHCGLIGFSSQKLQWRSNPFHDGKKYPFTIGMWEGIDGSQIMMAHGFDYGKRWADEDLSKNEQLQREISESPLGIAYRYYGTGDMGGSPNLASVSAVEKGIKGNGPVKIISATSDQVYKDFLPFEKHKELPHFRGELTMDVHGNGCYTSEAAMKLYNRQNEHLGDAAERTAVMADWLGTYKYPANHLTEIWKRTIWHQFHDDITGTSLPRAYEFSWNDELLSLKQFSEVLTTSVSGVASQMDTQVSGTPTIIYNNEDFNVTSLVEADVKGLATVFGPNGKRVPSQIIEKHGKKQVIFEATVPSTGFAVYSIKDSGKGNAEKSQSLKQAENSRYRIQLDDNGDIQSLYDKQYNRELVASGKRIRLVVFDDCTSRNWPAWEILKATIDKEPLGIECSGITYEPGTLRKTLVVRKKYGKTNIIQRIHLYEGALAYRIDFDMEVDWRSENSLLKAEFPLSVSNPEASYDLGLGSVKRSNNRDNQYEVYAHEWTDLTDKSGSYGVTILNNARYGWDKPNDYTLRHSLIYTPKTGNGYRYQAQQDMGHHVFTYSIIGHQGPLNEPEAVRQATALNSPLKAFTASKHKGQLGREFSFVKSDNDNVIIRALKRAEASDEYVVRVYETGGKQNQTAKLTFAAPIVSAVAADGTEKTIGQAAFQDRNLNVSINPYGVRTYKVKLQKKTQPAIHSAVLPLDYNRNCFSYNEFRSSANFENGFSYAAELLPDEGIDVDGIHFDFGKKNSTNGLACKGQSIDLMDALAGTPAKSLYILASSDKDDRQADFIVTGKIKNKVTTTSQSFNVPFYTGFIGQWGHDNHTSGFVKDARVAYVGTHRHSQRNDEPYEYTYMYLLKVDLPNGATSITLPNDEHLVIFAATLADGEERVAPTSQLFESSVVSHNEQ